MPKLLLFILVSLLVCAHSRLMAQDNNQEPLQLPEKMVEKLNGRVESISALADKQTEKLLRRLARLEHKLLKKLPADSAKQLLQQLNSQGSEYMQLLQNGRLPAGAGKLAGYIPYLDSLQSGFSFLTANPQLVKNFTAINGKLQSASGEIEEWRQKIAATEKVRKIIQERKKLLQEKFARYLPGKYLQKLNKEVYYYSQRVREYKEMMNDPGKLEKQTIHMLSKLPAFREFMKKNSQLAAMFGLPGDYSNNNASLAGLQTNNQVQQMLQQRLAAGGPNAIQQVQQNMQQAQAQLTQLKSKLQSMQVGDSDFEMPDFKPNKQKTKTFWQRLEYGANIQFSKENRFMPRSGDLAFSVGYKLNDKSVIGLGGSFKTGLFNGNHLRLSNQGQGYRSFIDWKIKGGFYLSGGYERNYLPAVSDARNNNAALQSLNAWQSSALLGVSKKYQLGKKLRGEAKLLYDFLYKRQLPAGQPVLFRIGYFFK